MKTFYLFRHAKSKRTGEHYSKDDIISAPILHEGIPPIKLMANFFKNRPIDAWYVSEYLRCKQTADIVSVITKKLFTVDRRLNEYNPHFLDETFAHFTKRIKSFLDEIVKTKNNNIAICTHGAVIAGIKYSLAGKEFKQGSIYNFSDSGAITIVKGENIKVINFTNS